MGRKSLKEPRQKEIIKAFYKVAKKEGLENASIAKTAESIHINPSLVMHYFKTREHLIYGLIEYILDKYLLIYQIPSEYAAHPRDTLLKVIDNIFSSKWNTLFDDSVSYSCYSLTFRNKIIKGKYKQLLDALRKRLEQLIQDCNNKGALAVDDPAFTADIIFVLVDGAYYYLSLVDDKEEYQRKLMQYKQQAITHLNFVSSVQSRK
jgi:AcrR family transcriptional regulator